MEDKIIQGKIEWISPAPKEFNDTMSIGIKIGGVFYNKYSSEEELKEHLKLLKKGYEVELTLDERKGIKTIEVISDKVEEKGFDDLTTFEELLEDAHTKFGDFTIKTEMVENDWEKQRAIFKATVDIISNDGGSYEYQAYGDATQDNCGEMVKKHYIRMAETRAIARALRWATNNAKAAKEETEDGKLPEESEVPSEKTN